MIDNIEAVKESIEAWNGYENGKKNLFGGLKAFGIALVVLAPVYLGLGIFGIILSLIILSIICIVLAYSLNLMISGKKQREKLIGEGLYKSAEIEKIIQEMTDPRFHENYNAISLGSVRLPSTNRGGRYHEWRAKLYDDFAVLLRLPKDEIRILKKEELDFQGKEFPLIKDTFVGELKLGPEVYDASIGTEAKTKIDQWKSY